MYKLQITNSYINALFLMLLVLLLQNCQKEIQDKVPIDNTPIMSETGEIILGDKFNNAYTIENMTKALDVLKKDNDLANEINISITNKYVRFLPKDTAEYNELYSKGLILIDHPLLYKIKQAGYFYQDKSIPKGEITWLYSVVDKDFVFPNIKYELLSDLFLPSTYKKISNSNLRSTLTQLEVLALELVGINETPTFANKKEGINAYAPSAKVTVTGSDNEAVEGVRMIAYHIFNFDEKFTDANGEVVFDNDFVFDVQYKLYWETRDFKLSYGLLTNYIVGPIDNNTWVLDIDVDANNNNLHLKRAMVFLGAYDFIFRPNLRGPITRPVRNGFITDIVVDNWNQGTSNAGFANINIIIVFTTNKLYPRQSYATSVHELGHMSHSVGAQGNYNILIIDYLNPNKLAAITLESWAKHVEWFICQNKYPTHYTEIDHNLVPLFNGNVKRLYNQMVLDLTDITNEGLINVTNTVLDPDLYFITFEPNYKITNDIIYYSPNPNAQTQADLCPTFNSYLASNGYCYLIDVPTNDPFMYFELGNNNNSLNFYTWGQFPYVAQASVLPYDRVSGYTLSEIQSALYDSEDWYSWRDNILNSDPNNPTKQFVNELFSNWY